MEIRTTWIIGISTEDRVSLYRFFGNKEEAKEKLLDLVNEDKKGNENGWEYGCKCIDDIETVDNGVGNELYTYVVYTDIRINYTAKALAHIEQA